MGIPESHQGPSDVYRATNKANMKASLFFIALVGVAALASGLKVRQEFFSYTSTELMAPLDDVIKEIKAEEVDDLNNIAHAKTSMEAAMKQAATDLAAWKKTQADLLLREKEYATNDEVRAAEEGKVSQLEKTFVKLTGVGPADGTIGLMPASRLLNSGNPNHNKAPN